MVAVLAGRWQWYLNRAKSRLAARWLTGGEPTITSETQKNSGHLILCGYFSWCLRYSRSMPTKFEGNRPGNHRDSSNGGPRPHNTVPSRTGDDSGLIAAGAIPFCSLPCTSMPYISPSASAQSLTCTLLLTTCYECSTSLRLDYIDAASD